MAGGAGAGEVTLTTALVRRFEALLADAAESLLSRSLQVPGNPEGYAVFRDGPVCATLSTNPKAGWATQAYGLTGQPPEMVARVVEFYRAHKVPARVRIVPDGFDAAQAEILSAHGLPRGFPHDPVGPAAAAGRAAGLSTRHS